MSWRRILGFFAFCCGVAILAVLAVLLTGNGILMSQRISEGRISCRYLTIRGVVAKEFSYGHVNFGRWNCDIATDPSKSF